MKDDICLVEEAANGVTKRETAVERIDPLFAGYVGAVRGDGEPNVSVLGDLLADLHHWADHHQVNWETALASGELHHDAESDELRDGVIGHRDPDEDEHEDGDGCAIYDSGYRVYANGDTTYEVQVDELEVGDTYCDDAAGSQWWPVSEVARVGDDVHVASEPEPT